MLDTHQFVKSLRDSGVPEAQAEALVNGISGALRESVASKTDVSREFGSLRTDMAHEFSVLRNEVKQETVAVKNEVLAVESRLNVAVVSSRNTMIVWIVGLFIALGLIQKYIH